MTTYIIRGEATFKTLRNNRKTATKTKKEAKVRFALLNGLTLPTIAPSDFDLLTQATKRLIYAYHRQLALVA